MSVLTPSVDTQCGPVQGFIEDGVSRYLGIPYAQPPVGALRWRAPQSPEPWSSPLDSTRFRSACAQTTTLYGFAAPSDTEDCLYLNVFTPSERASEPLPVMVWIHGGGLFSGSAEHYDASLLVAAGPVVLVTISYRLNLFGFFCHPEIEAEDNSDGNYGFLDQQFALAWVRDNIDGFGGDPTRVTIFGESAGATSVEAHLVAAGSSGLFHRAIVQSSGAWSRGSIDPAQARSVASEFARAAGCTSAAELRSLSTRAVLSLNQTGDRLTELSGGRYGVGLVIGGSVLCESIHDAFAAGRFTRVPVIRGMNRDEYRWYIGLDELDSGVALSETGYLARAGELFGWFAGEVLERYPIARYSSASHAFGAVMSDWRSISGERDCVRAMARHTRVHPYQFDVAHARIATPAVSFDYGSCHTAELPYVFPGFSGASNSVPVMSNPQRRLAASMAEAWTSFAAAGVPTYRDAARGGDVQHWPAYDERHDAVLRFRLPQPDVFDGVASQHHCDLWANVRAAFARSTNNTKE